MIRVYSLPDGTFSSDEEEEEEDEDEEEEEEEGEGAGHFKWTKMTFWVRLKSGMFFISEEDN